MACGRAPASLPVPGSARSDDRRVSVAPAHAQPSPSPDPYPSARSAPAPRPGPVGIELRVEHHGGPGAPACARPDLVDDAKLDELVQLVGHVDEEQAEHGRRPHTRGGPGDWPSRVPPLAAHAKRPRPARLRRGGRRRRRRRIRSPPPAAAAAAASHERASARARGPGARRARAGELQPAVRPGENERGEGMKRRGHPRRPPRDVRCARARELGHEALLRLPNRAARRGPPTAALGTRATSPCRGAAAVRLRDDHERHLRHCGALHRLRRQGSITVSVIVRRDATPPSVRASADRGPDNNGWYNRAVTVSFEGDDGTSGIASCASPAPTWARLAGATSVSGSCVDNAGNTGSDSHEFGYAPPHRASRPGRPPRTATECTVAPSPSRSSAPTPFPGSTPARHPCATRGRTSRRRLSRAAARTRRRTRSAPVGFELRYDTKPPALGWIRAESRSGASCSGGAGVEGYSVVRGAPPAGVAWVGGRRRCTPVGRQPLPIAG